jgi:hypothetical protein
MSSTTIILLLIAVCVCISISIGGGVGIYFATQTTTPAPTTTKSAKIEEAAEPAATTAEPAVTTAEPAVTTAEPAVTTAEPAVTTAEPAVTTAEPIATTAEPAATPAPAAGTPAPTTTMTQAQKDANATKLAGASEIMKIGIENQTVDFECPVKSGIITYGSTTNYKIPSGTTTLMINNTVMGRDPAPGIVKKWVAKYQCSTPPTGTPAASEYTKVGIENQTVDFGCPVKSGFITYGSTADYKIPSGTTTLTINNTSMGGDPAHGIVKEWVAKYQCSAPAAGTPAPAKAQEGLVKSNHRENYCLDVPRADTANGVQLHAWDCHGGDNQLFTYTDNQEIKIRHSGKCLDVASASKDNGGIVHQWDCHGGDNQKWIYNNGQLKPKHAPGKCLDIVSGGKENGSLIQIWDCHGGSNQKWTPTAK